jgi:malonyl CoA-acyl carrier protein transacylase/phosphopantetheinyl transferase
MGDASTPRDAAAGVAIVGLAGPGGDGAVAGARAALADAGAPPGCRLRLTLAGATGDAGARVAAGLPAAVQLAAADGELAAVADAVDALVAEACDLALVGTAAAEGPCVVLERAADAARRGQRAYAIVAAALRGPDDPAAWDAAYRQAGIDPTDLGLLVPAATPSAGVERACGLSRLLGDRGAAFPRCAVAFADGELDALVAVARALWATTLPATAEPALAPRLAGSGFYLVTEPRAWFHGDATRPRAGVAAAAGIHVVLAEAPAGLARPAPRRWPSELVCLSAPTRAVLIERVLRLGAALAADPGGSLAAVAAGLAAEPAERHRLALVATDLPDLLARLAATARRLRAVDRPRLATKDGVFVGDAGDPAAGERGGTAFLFPGQGAQYLHMGVDLCRHFPSLRRWFDRLDATLGDVLPAPATMLCSPPEAGLTEPQQRIVAEHLQSLEDGAQAGFVLALGLAELLRELSVPCDVMVGYSLGENAALIASNVLRLADRAELFRFMRRIKVETATPAAQSHIPRGVAVAVSLTERETIARLVTRFAGRLFLAMDNCPHQVVLFGEAAAMDAATADLRAVGAICVRLPFDRAYHTPLFARKAGHLREIYEEIAAGPGDVPVLSCVALDRFPDDPAAIRDLAIRQWVETVRFREAVERLYADGVRTFVEVGPGATLTGFVRDTLRGRACLALASSLPGRPGLRQLQELLAQLWVGGAGVRIDRLFEDACSPAAGGIPAPPEVPPAARPAARAGGAAGREILDGHLALAREFLASQARMARALVAARSAAGVAPAGRAPAEPTPLPAARPRAVPAAPRRPLLEGARERTASGARFVCRLDPARHPFLRDHALGPPGRGEVPAPLAVVPFTIAMELLAEAALGVTAEPAHVVALHDIRGSRWLALDRGSLDVELTAEILSGDGRLPCGVRTQLFEQAPEGRRLAFEAEVRLAAGFAAAPTPLDLALEPPPPTAWPAEDFCRLIFHGPSLQSVRRLRGLGSDGIEAEVEVPPDGLVDGGPMATGAALPAQLLDGAGHLVGYWRLEAGHSDFGSFPFQARRFEQFRPPPAAGTRLVARARIRPAERVVEADVEFLDGDRRVVARLSGFACRYFDLDRGLLDSLYRPGPGTFLSRPWTPLASCAIARRIDHVRAGLLDEGGGIWKRALAHVTLSAAERAAWYALPETGRRREEWLLGRIAAKDAVRQWAAERGLHLSPQEIDVLPDARGKPRAGGRRLAEAGLAVDVSITHANGTVAAALVDGGRRVGLDLEVATARRPGDWLERAFTAEELAVVGSREPAVLLGLWCAKEAAAKAVGAALEGEPRRWRILEVSPDARRVVVEHDGEPLPVELRMADGEWLALCVAAPASVPGGGP